MTREANWFPVTVEVRNDGPTFPAVIELSAYQMNRSQVRRVPIELPTGTLKRVTIPVFASARHVDFQARLVTEKGKVVDEKLVTLKQRNHDTIFVGSLSRTTSGSPILPQVKRSVQEYQQPSVTRLQPAIFPDNPIALEGLQVIYLSSERALDLKVNQANALMAWLQNGGHLVVGIEQVGDLNGVTWLRDLLPVQLDSMTQISTENVFQQWLKSGASVREVVDEGENGFAKKQHINSARTTTLWNAADTNIINDATFESAKIEVALGEVKEGRVLASAGNVPLAIEKDFGRGKITVLTFSPERQPFLGWNNRPWFWAMLTDVPAQLFEKGDYINPNYGGYSSDGVFGSMIESKQIRKLPLAWLLLLLLVYLVVIGPFDQIFLKRINRQMLTWITFPLYVVAFSGLIYFIGFRLRAGDSEYNELHVVDILPTGAKAVLHGRTFASIYSPANERYQLEGGQFMATLRGEYMANYGGGQENSQASVIHRGNNFDAEVFVPVWTSQLYVNDWYQPVSGSPVEIKVTDASQLTFSVQNNLDRQLTQARVCISGQIYDLGNLPAKESKRFKLQPNQGRPVRDFVTEHGANFFSAVEMRRQTFGGDEYKTQWNLPLASMAGSFISNRNEQQNYRRFVSPGGLDLSRFADAGDIILLAWDGGHSLTTPMNHFKPRRSESNTLLRLVVPVANTKL